MMKTALALAAVLGLANGQAPTAAAPNNQCDDEGDACMGAEPEGGGDRTGGNAGCMAALAEWNPEGGTEADCAGNAQCTAVVGCFAQLILFHEARGDARDMCPWVGGIWGGTLRTEDQCTSPACKWCAADAECDSQRTEDQVCTDQGCTDGAAIASCTYDPAFVLNTLGSPTTAGATFVAASCALKNAEARCTRVEDPPRTAAAAECTANDSGSSANVEACAAVTDLDDYDACYGVTEGNGCSYSREVTEFAGEPAPCVWTASSSSCAATAAATTAATAEFAEAINDANAATAAIGAKTSHAVTAAALPGALAALFMCLAYY